VIEEIEIRVPEDRVGEIFSSDEGESIAGTRVLRLQSTDARLVKVRELHRRKWKEGGYFYSSAVPHRAYTSAELDSSEVLLLRPQALFEPAGEECGTIYDDVGACAACGVADQLGPLRLPLSRIPTGVDFAVTIAGEMLLSDRAFAVFDDAQLSGFATEPILDSDSMGGAGTLPHWRQLLPDGVELAVSRDTLVGWSWGEAVPWPRYPRSCDHLIGPRLISELQVIDPGLRTDSMRTAGFFGERQGLLRPRPIMCTSPSVRTLVAEAALQGFIFERALFEGSADTSGSS